MAEFPALPLFTDAYLGDTTHLTTIEHGAYLLLLMAAWRSPGACLPDDDAKLARYARMTRGQWARVGPTIRDFFRAENGMLYQSRLTDEAVLVRQKRESQSRAGKASALKRKGRHSTGVDPRLNGCATPTPTPTPTPTVVEEDSPPTTTVERAPAGADDGGTWDAVELADHVARVAGVRHLEPGRIASNVRVVREWLEAGADPPLIATTVQAGRDSAVNGIHSLAYFDTRVRNAVARRDHPHEPTDDDLAAIRDPLLRRYLANGGTLARGAGA